jgi:hypothetical protein
MSTEVLGGGVELENSVHFLPVPLGDVVELTQGSSHGSVNDKDGVFYRGYTAAGAVEMPYGDAQTVQV